MTIGIVIGPTAAIVAPSLIKFVRMPVIKLVEMQSPVGRLQWDTQAYDSTMVIEAVNYSPCGLIPSISQGVGMCAHRSK